MQRKAKNNKDWSNGKTKVNVKQAAKSTISQGGKLSRLMPWRLES